MAGPVTITPDPPQQSPPVTITPDAPPGGPPVDDLLSRSENFIDQMDQGISQGAGKSINFISKGLNRLPLVGKYLAPQEGINAVDAATVPQNTGQRVGQGIEQAEEMEALGGPLRSGATKLAGLVPSITKYLAPALRVGADAANSAASAEVHGQPVGTSALIGGGTSAVGEGLSLLPPALRKAAASQYTSGLAPTTRPNKALAQNIVPGMIQRGVHGTLDAIDDQATAQAGAVRPALDSAYKSLPVSATAGSGPKVIQDLEGLKSDYIVNGQIANPQAVDAINGVQDIVRQQGADISPQSLRQLKHIFDEPVAKAGGYAGTDLATHYQLNAQEAAANSIRKILHQASPDINALDKEVSFWLNVQKVTGDSALRQTGQQGGLLKVLAPLGSATAGALGVSTHGAVPSLEAAASAALMTKMTMAMRSPEWRTASAIVKDRLAGALARGDGAQVAALLGRFGVAAQGSLQANAPSAPTSPSQ